MTKKTYKEEAKERLDAVLQLVDGSHELSGGQMYIDRARKRLFCDMLHVWGFEYANAQIPNCINQWEKEKQSDLELMYKERLNK